MGLFSFVKDAGRKIGLFGGREAAQAEEAKAQALAAAETAAAEAHGRAQGLLMAADIKAAILSYVEIESLEVSFEGETATVQGHAASQKDAEIAILVAGNTEGVGQVDAQIEVGSPEAPSAYHTVASGDTLSKLSLQYYGVIRMFDAIFESNQPMISDPDEIYPGQVLRVPPIETPIHQVASGETLGTIAKHWFGDPGRYTDIFEANRDVLSSADVVEVGQQLKIPVKQPND